MSSPNSVRARLALMLGLTLGSFEACLLGLLGLFSTYAHGKRTFKPLLTMITFLYEGEYKTALTGLIALTGTIGKRGRRPFGSSPNLKNLKTLHACARGGRR